MPSAWSTVATQWTPSGLYLRANKEGIGNLLGQESDATIRDGLVQTVGIDLMAALYRQKLMQRFTEEYSDTLEAIQVEYVRRLQMAAEFQNHSGRIAGVDEVIGQVALSGAVVGAFPLGTSVFVPTDGIYGQVQNLKPGYWFIDSSVAPINSSLLANQTQPGDYMGDMNPKVTVDLYINQGTSAVPVWNAADSQKLVDYIYNPSEILEVGYRRTKLNIKIYAMDVPKSAELEWNYTYLPPAIKAELLSLQEDEQLSFALLRIDRSANGIISDYDKDAGKITKWFA